ncbi:hypothetical protein B296_00057624 [Ensete ventricosum]|uniref:Uncharacterized protein n=1 Tax=Ensete ventricosum TaxID=4639 RepID=A0A426X5J5_ENSVE|nr:hypothetical protein B296_00057624 [Ensete ventricosum]
MIGVRHPKRQGMLDLSRSALVIPHELQVEPKSRAGRKSSRWQISRLPILFPSNICNLLPRKKKKKKKKKNLKGKTSTNPWNSGMPCMEEPPKDHTYDDIPTCKAKPHSLRSPLSSEVASTPMHVTARARRREPHYLYFCGS